MKINTNSWHYKILSSRDSYAIPRNLCPYVRKVLLVCLFWAVVVSLGAWFFHLAVITPVYALVFYTITGMPISLDVETYTALGVYVGLLGVVVGLIMASFLALVFSASRAYEYLHKHRRPLEAREPKEPNIFIAYIKAAHDKVCPQLEFKE